MGEIAIRFIGEEHATDINIKNEPFQLFGWMRPCYQDGKWSFSTVENENIEWQRLPDWRSGYGCLHWDEPGEKVRYLLL